MFKYILILIFSSLTYADDFATEECYRQGREHMGRKGITYIDSECEELTKNRSNTKTKFSSPDNQVYGHGNKNFIFITTKDMPKENPTIKKNIITGSQSELKTIHSIKLDLKNRIIVVLANEDNSIYNFRIDQGGNVGAIRTLKSDDLKTATNILPINDFNQLAVIHKESNKIVFYNRFADIRGTSKEFSTRPIRQIQSPLSLLNQPEDAFIKNNLLYVYNSGSNTIVVFDIKDLKDQSPIKTLQLSEHKQGKIIKIEAGNKNTIELTTDQDKKLKYKINELGFQHQ